MFVIAKRRGRPLTDVLAAAETVLANLNREPTMDIAERVAHRRGVMIDEVIQQARAEVELARLELGQC